MRSGSDDRTARATIRDEALRLFAERGPDAVPVREIAAAAGVSPALVLHHWGSKDGLRRGVDEHVSAVLELLLDGVSDELRAAGAPSGGAGHSGSSLARALLAHLPPDSPVPPYLRRLWLSGDPAGTALLRRWYDASLALLAGMEAAGIVRGGLRPEVRAAVLMTHDLAVLLLRDGLRDVLGTDPLGEEGLTRWSEEVLDIYSHGLLVDQGDSDAD